MAKLKKYILLTIGATT